MSICSVVRFTDFVTKAFLPSSELLGYCQPSANADLGQLRNKEPKTKTQDQRPKTLTCRLSFKFIFTKEREPPLAPGKKCMEQQHDD